MASTNKPTVPLRTHEGGIAKRISPADQLRRSVGACLLWEKEFYETGEDIASRISSLVKKVDAPLVAEIAIDARSKLNLRHVPLWIVVSMCKASAAHQALVASTLELIIQRPDELAEYCALTLKANPGKSLGKCLSAKSKQGLAAAFGKFGEYSLAKYNRDNAVKLRDVLRLCHPKPKDADQANMWRRLIRDELATPDTWEVALSGGADKRETFTRLIQEEKLGGLALLRNLRNMEQSGVSRPTILNALAHMRTERILPFRFIAAAQHAPSLEAALEAAMFRNTAELPKLAGSTVLLVDISGSMEAKISAKSDLKRVDAAYGLAMLLREICEDLRVFSFSDRTVLVKPWRGFGLRDAINRSQAHNSTRLDQAVMDVSRLPYDRIITITDEQTMGRVQDPNKGSRAYMINVACARNGVGYGPWTHLDGFSEAVVNFIQISEQLGE